MTPRDQTAWLGWEDSNSEMSTQITSLKDRTDLRESSRILAFETIRVWAAALGDTQLGRSWADTRARRPQHPCRHASERRTAL